MRIIYLPGFHFARTGVSDKGLKLAQSHDAEIIDWSGHCSLERTVNHVNAQIRPAEDTIVIGSSFGGYLATLLDKHPSMRYILINPAGLHGQAPAPVLQQYPTIKQHPLKNTLDNSTVVILSRNDEIVAPTPTSEFFEPYAKVVWVEDDHRASLPATFDAINMAIDELQAYDML